jgi:glycosyltransferase involved in cell wall biosynthesis
VTRPASDGALRWAVLAQAHGPGFQELIQHLASRFGPCLLLTGTPFDVPPDVPLTVRRATAYDRRGVGRRAVSWTRYLVDAARAMSARDRVPRVFAATNPPLLPHLAWALRKLRGVRYALLIWDIYPEHLVQMGWFRRSHPVVWAWAALNRRALLEADVVITLSESMAETLREGLGSNAGKCRVEVIPNWADTDVIRPLDKTTNPFAVQHRQTDKITVMYAGNLGATHDLSPVIEAAAALRGDTRLHFMFVGTGLGRDVLEKQAAAHGLENVTFCEPVPWAEVPAMLAAADIAVVAQASRSAHLSLPSKTYNALAAGSAILALTPANSDLARLVTGCGVGAVCDPDEIGAAVRSILRLADDPVGLAAARERARTAAETQFSAAVVRDRFSEVLARTLFAEGG